MALQLKIISEHSEIVGDDSVREFAEDGGTMAVPTATGRG